jgi:UDP-2,4-diacetamido-2,4,6-trideoxy-beta-L-altropyranose hydrolase
MFVVFRVDASVEIGTGHAMRCLTLALALRQQGAECVFICREHVGNLLAHIRMQGFTVHALPYAGTKTGPGYAAWLGSSWKADAEQTLVTLNGRIADWLIVDHYALDIEWETQLRPACRHLMVIDDLADRQHDCDLLLDQNLYALPERRYVGRLPISAKLLLGPRYSLLRPEFLFMRKLLRERSGSVNRIFLFMGGSDSRNVTATAIQAIRLSQYSHLVVDIVVGGTNPHVTDLAEMAGYLPQATLHRQPSNLAEMMVAADLAIGAAGVSTWERAALGLPALAVSVANNQREIARYANEVGLLTWMGDVDELSTQDWISSINNACASTDTLGRQSQLCLELVDAQGAGRVVEAML